MLYPVVLIGGSGSRLWPMSRTAQPKQLLPVASQSYLVYIPLGMLHRQHTPGNIPLHLIEVQPGSYLGEDDIVRVDDRYGRLDDPTAHNQGPGSLSSPLPDPITMLDTEVGTICP